MSADVITFPNRTVHLGGLVYTVFYPGDAWSPDSWFLYFGPEDAEEPELLGSYFDAEEPLQVGREFARLNRARFVVDLTHEIAMGGAR